MMHWLSVVMAVVIWLYGAQAWWHGDYKEMFIAYLIVWFLCRKKKQKKACGCRCA